jgi:hypothetical protein
MAIRSWGDAKADAMKILGDKAKIPEPKVKMAKIGADFAKADKEYDAAVDVLQSKILAFQNSNSAAKNAGKQYEDLISKSDFGLDQKDDDDKKKIEKARKVLTDYLDSVLEIYDDNIKNLDELDKHSMAISKYENKCPS